jgi:hypothetical protein
LASEPACPGSLYNGSKSFATGVCDSRTPVIDELLAMGGRGGVTFSVLRPPSLRCRILGYEVHLSSVRWMGEIFCKMGHRSRASSVYPHKITATLPEIWCACSQRARASRCEMRMAILLFSFCAGPALFGSACSGLAAFGQSAPGDLLNPNSPGQSPWTAQSRDFSKLPPGWSGAAKAPLWTVLQRAPRARMRDAQIDPQMILHPTARDLGTQPPGTLVAQNLYPGLKFQPIDAQVCTPRGGLLSTTWPKLKIEEIPIFWPDLKTEPVGRKPSSSAKIVP